MLLIRIICFLIVHHYCVNKYLEDKEGMLEGFKKLLNIPSQFMKKNYLDLYQLYIY